MTMAKHPLTPLVCAVCMAIGAICPAYSTAPGPTTNTPFVKEAKHGDLTAGDLDNASLSTKIRAQALQIDVVLSAKEQAVLEAKVATTVMSIKKQMGNPIEAGELLVQLDDRTFVANENKAKSALEKAQAVLKAKQQLFVDKVSSVVEVKTAEADVATAQANLAAATYDLEGCRILAPYPGHLAEVFIHEYEQVQIGEPIIKVVDDRELTAKMLLPSANLLAIKLGDKLDIYINEMGSTVTSTITNIGAVIDPASSMVKVYATIDNSAGHMRAGMIGTAYLPQKK